MYARAYRKRRIVSLAKPSEECLNCQVGGCLIGPEAPRQPTWLPRLRDCDSLISRHHLLPYLTRTNVNHAASMIAHLGIIFFYYVQSASTVFAKEPFDYELCNIRTPEPKFLLVFILTFIV